MKIVIDFIPHAQQRYPTVGDWFWKGTRDDPWGELHIRISHSGEIASDLLVALHELVEAILCWHDGVTQDAVDKFDTSHAGQASDEPGDEPDAPYRDQHCFATAVERMVCAAMKMAWREHEENLEKCVSLS